MSSLPVSKVPIERPFKPLLWLGFATSLWLVACGDSSVSSDASVLPQRDAGPRDAMADATPPDTAPPTPDALPPPAQAKLAVRAATQTCLLTLPFPAKISETGCYTNVAKLVHTPDLVPYEVASALWTDGAHKARFLVIPPGKSVSFDSEGRPQFPEETVFLKEFAVQLNDADPGSVVQVETRFMRKNQFGWDFASYQWLPDGSDATVVPSGHYLPLQIKGTTGDTRTLNYLFPGNGDCLTCHSPTVPQYFGPAPAQLYMDVSYDHVRKNQLEALSELGLFDKQNMKKPDFQVVDPKDASQPLEARARSWLHANCSHCHQPGGWTPPLLTMDLRYDRLLPLANVCNVRTQYLTTIPRVKPGDPMGSAIWRRISSSGFDRMPPIGVSVTDPTSDVVRQWIASLTACPPKPAETEIPAPLP